MKKKLFSLLLCVTCIGTLLTGCQMTDSTEGVSAVQEESSDVASEENDADSTAVSKTAKMMLLNWICILILHGFLRIPGRVLYLKH